MTTINASLKTYEKLSLSMTRIQMNMGAMENSARKMKSAFESPIRMSTDVSAMEASLTRVTEMQANVEEQLSASDSAAKGLLGRFKGIASTVFSMDNIKILLGATLGGAMEQQKLLDAFVARTGDAQVGKALFEQIKSEALAAGQDVNETMKNTLSFMGNIDNTDLLSQLNAFASRMAAFDMSGGGISAAAEALKEAMAGDAGALASQYNIPQAEIDASNIEALADAGDMDGFLQAFDTLLEKQNMGKEAFDQMMASPANQVDQLGNRFKSVMADAGSGALQAIGPIVEQLNELLSSPAGTAFFQMLNEGLQLAGQAAYWLISALAGIGDLFESLYGVIEPVLFMVGGAFLLWAVTQIPALIGQLNAMLIKLWLMVEPILAQAGAWLVANWPILLIGALIGFLIYCLYKWSDTTSEVLGIVGGIFGVLFAFLFNRFAYFANIVLSVAEFFVNVWSDPIYAVKKLFYDLVINALSYLNNLAKGVEKIINAIPGLKVNLTGGMDNILQQLEDARDNLKSDKDVVKLKRFEQIDYGTAFDVGQDMGKKFGDKAASGLHGLVDKAKGMFGPSSIGKDTERNMNIGKVDEVGKVNSTVEISSEDLKVIRDLAEIQSIQNFVTLTPTVNVTTGPVSKEVDVDDVILKIGARVSQEIESSANGAYAG
ncbi:hypothetical protein [Cohnella panacarvi]|uniref:hypothetical protein n=1 Tax=Cohnella panacarvi TaxID=400776 RepID=UPI00047DDC63|nr:hypothetical protein [Cohnella panacarvi]